jgi:nucleotide-binding universal stress UspA family protein
MSVGAARESGPAAVRQKGSAPAGAPATTPALPEAAVEDTPDAARAAARPAQHAALHTLLVPVDGSHFSQAALAPGAALAARLDAEIVIVQEATPAYVPGIAEDLALQLGESDAQRSLDQSLELVRRTGLRARAILLVAQPGVSPAEAIVAATTAVDAGLIVMATHGRSGVQRAVLGSVADGVVCQSSTPVLLVRPQVGRLAGGAAWWAGWATETAALGQPAGQAHPGAHEPLCILVALDGSPEGESGLAVVASLARALAARVSLAHVAPTGHLRAGGAGRDLAGPGGPAYLEQVALRLQGLGLPPAAIHAAVRYGPVAPTLLDQAAREHASILALSTHGCGGLARLIHGSVTSLVVEQAAVPVLVTRRC